MYVEPERLKEIIAETLFGKKFEELSDVERQRVQAVAQRLEAIA